MIVSLFVDVGVHLFQVVTNFANCYKECILKKEMHLTAFAEEVRRLDNQRTLDKITANGSERFNATMVAKTQRGTARM